MMKTGKIMLSLFLMAFIIGMFNLRADELIVLNGLAETLSRVDLESGSVENNFVSLGLIPNYVVCKNDMAYVVNSGSDDLYIIDLPGGTVDDIIDLGSGRNPWAEVFVNDTVLIISNFNTSTISKVDVRNRDIIGEWPVEPRPQGMLTIRQRTYIAISGFNPSDLTYGQGMIAVWDNSGDSLIEYIDVGVNPQDLDIGPDGRLYVVCTGDYEGQAGMLYIIDTVELLAVDSFQTSTALFPPTDVVVSPDGVGYLAAGGWAGYGEVYTFDPINAQILHGQSNPLKTGTGVFSVLKASDSTVFTMNFGADNVTEMDSAGNILHTYSVGDGPQVGVIYRNSPQYICGDANADGGINVSDAVYIINYVFIGGAAPIPYEAGDANCDGGVNVSDAVYIINYVFVGGSDPCDPNNDGIPDC
jgi:hypothetical protein